MDAQEKWATETEMILPRFALERAVRALDRIEAIALIRAAYQCNLKDGIAIYDLIIGRAIKL